MPLSADGDSFVLPVDADLDLAFFASLQFHRPSPPYGRLLIASTPLPQRSSRRNTSWPE